MNLYTVGQEYNENWSTFVSNKYQRQWHCQFIGFADGCVGSLALLFYCCIDRKDVMISAERDTLKLDRRGHLLCSTPRYSRLI